MYAVVESGNRQYKVSKNDTILVELFKAKEGANVKLDKILLAKDGNSIYVGNPYLKGSNITCEVVGAVRDEKVVAYKYKRRKSEKKKIGHRQDLLKLKVKEIEIAKG
jgi:large subunit ribosomal protein L21